jgi:signal transduction histidine kinase
MDQSLAKATSRYVEALDRSAKTFVAILGHDLRNPLAAVSLWSRVIASQAADARDAELGDAARHIMDSAQAMEEMVSHLVDLTATTFGNTLSIAPQNMDLDALCREVIDETGAAFPKCNIQYTPQGELTGQWDRARLRQALSNLLSNGIQHGDEQAPVTLTVVADPPRAEQIRVSVHNGGPPIPKDVLPTIFDPFVHASRQLHAQRRPGSIGLGLYIARSIVQAHGGELSVT